ncbi:serine/threonine-protein kinase [Nocardia yamanashiensis]|uniref:serine/threonine-protein kinase n=1 Tax=Nocardia yamanashiensis TaxID=209247 RepID=UPI001E2AFDCB|nr:serine/threonine-protein kinase [Nocardia yamanashiensis]UGT44778.1 serine/threonine-protein kinase [Nocardia yamanashiensis]
MSALGRPGWVLGGRYRLIEKLGSGGFGTVWKARDERSRVDVAVKEVLLPQAESDAEHAERVARAEREARNAVRLRDHPNIVSVLDVVTDGGTPWIVMDLVAGRSLKQRVDAEGPVGVADAGAIADAMLRALRAAHDAGVVHRDVKPGNILLGAGGEVLLTDFGTARHHSDHTLTAKETIIGSFEYMAPERIDGDDTPAGDLYSLGVTLYQAVEGVSPFRRDTIQGTMKAVMFAAAPLPARAGQLARLITRLMDKQPELRPSISEALLLLTERTPPAPKQLVPPTNSRSPESGRKRGEVGQLLARAREYQQRGNIREAERLLRQAASSNDALAMSFLARLLENRGARTEAERWYRRAAESGETLSMLTLGHMCLQSGDLNQAAYWYRRYVDHGHVLGKVHLAAVHEARGETDRAELLYREVEQDSDMVALKALGDQWKSLGRTDAAKRAYRKSAQAGYAPAKAALESLPRS